jgi:hypothetical protein
VNQFDTSRAGRLLLLSIIIPGAGCSSSSRRLDGAFTAETYRAVMKFSFEPGATDPGILKQLAPGDIITFSSSDPSSGSSVVFSNAVSQISHVAIIFRSDKRLMVLSADSERGVYVDSIPACVKNRKFYVFAFPPETLDTERLSLFAQRAGLIGRMDYNWSAMFGWNSNLTPNTLQEVSDEYTCATSVAAALHFSGLSLDSAWWGVVTPGDIVFSVARRNMNGPSAGAREKSRQKRQAESPSKDIWEDLR